MSDNLFGQHLEVTREPKWHSGLGALFSTVTLLLIVCSPAIVWAVYTAVFS